MFKSRRFIILLCALLCVVLAALIYCERRNPEAGSELMRRLLARCSDA